MLFQPNSQLTVVPTDPWSCCERARMCERGEINCIYFLLYHLFQNINYNIFTIIVFYSILFSSLIEVYRSWVIPFLRSSSSSKAEILFRTVDAPVSANFPTRHVNFSSNRLVFGVRILILDRFLFL